jgi:endonuclease YncB( thermonuclease family)
MSGKVFTLYVTLIEWIDGDTFRGTVDQAFWTYHGRESKPIRCRCALIAAPELRYPGGPEALEAAKRLAPPGEYQCISYKPDPDNVGRPLLDLVLPGAVVGPAIMFSAVMVAAGHAGWYKP